MKDRRPFVDHLAPFFPPLLLAVCIAAGGASQNNLLQASILQLIAILCLFWLLFDSDFDPLPVAARPALWLAFAFVAIAALQLIPLPPELWGRLPGRDLVSVGFEAMGAPAPMLPISLAPAETVSAALNILPPLALFVLVSKLRWRHAIAPMLWVVPLLGAASVALGMLQVMGGPRSEFYFHEPSGRGWPIGFLANPNHQATLLIMCLPFVGAWIRELRRDGRGGKSNAERMILALALGGTCFAGAIAAGSIAGFILLGPVTIGSVLIAIGGRGKKVEENAAPRTPALALGVLLAGAIAGVLASSPHVLTASTNLEDKHLSRPDIYAHTLEAIRAQGVIGAGLGSFKQVYALFEDPAAVTTWFASHAHNEYLELVLEAGLAGGALIAAALVWLLWAGVRVFAGPRSEEGYIRQAAFLSLCVPVFHSLVDYPLRTISVAALAALCAAILTAERRRKGSGGSARESDDAETHLVL